MNKVYLTTKISEERYSLFMLGNLLVFSGYTIVTIETIIAIYLKLSVISYRETFFISLPILTLSLILSAFTYLKKNFLVWHEFAIFGIYCLTFLFAFCLWVYKLGDLRLLGIINVLTAITIVLTYTNIIQSLMMSVSTFLGYYLMMFYSIKIAGQSGSLVKETFLTFCLLPAFILIASTSYYISKKRNALQKVKLELEILNFNLSESNDKLLKEQMISEIEMDLAGEIQRAILPGKVPDTTDWDIAFMTKPSGIVSGDFYDFYWNRSSLKGISLFDVSGHGIAPALITILAKPVLYSHFMSAEFSNLGEVLESTNSDLLNELEEVNVYITGIILRMKNNEVEYVNAGHPDLIHFKSSEKKVLFVSDSSNLFKGHPLGISLSRQRYQSHKLNVSSGDFLILYSDGLTECKNFEGEQFSSEILTDAIESYRGTDAAGLLNSILDSLNRFTGNLKAGDDITIIVARKV